METANNQPDGVEFYIPHKPVVGDGAESTKERIVYDASVRPHPEVPSLNAAPSLQHKLWNVLVCMSFHPEDFLQVRIKEAEQERSGFTGHLTNSRTLKR